MNKLILTLICLVAAIPSQARTITVDDDGPADFNNIQAGIDDANNGDVIEVQPGTTQDSRDKADNLKLASGEGFQLLDFIISIPDILNFGDPNRP